MKLVGWAALYMGVGLVVVSTAAWYLQGYLIYHPRPYTPVVLAALPPHLVEIAYDTAQGSQVAFYLPPHDSPTHAPEALWVLFHGNASLALDWLVHLPRGLKTQKGFLLIDYPGYGKCTGRSSRDAIIASFEAALQTLQQRYLAVRPAVEQLPQCAWLLPWCGCGPGTCHPPRHAAYCASCTLHQHARYCLTHGGMADHGLAPGTV